MRFLDGTASRAAGAAVWPRSSRSRIASVIFGPLALLAAAPAQAVTLDNGVVLITQADALAGGVTPGDAAGFPITLSVPGTYRLASGLQVGAAVNGISVTAPEVTIDFAGFRMAGGGVAAKGILGTQRALTIRNGTIRGFTSDVIYSAGDYTTIDRMRIVDNPILSAIQVGVTAGHFASITNSNLSRNGQGTGVNCLSYCRVQNNIITGTGAVAGGISVNGSAAVVTGNTISNHAGAILTNGSVSFGDNVIIGNSNASLGTLLPLDPNQPPPPP